MDEAAATKSVALELLPEAGKQLVHHAVLANPRRHAKHPRKRKRVEPPSPFLTPDEVEEASLAAAEQNTLSTAEIKASMAAYSAAVGQPRLKKIHPAARLFM